MRGSLVTFLVGGALAIGGYAMPVAFPNIDPTAGMAMLVVAATLLVVAAILFVVELWRSRGSREAPAMETRGDHSPAQQHSGSGHNINAHTVNFGEPRFEITDRIADSIILRLNMKRPALLLYPDTGRNPQLASALADKLRNRDVSVHLSPHKGYVSGLVFREPLKVHPNGMPLELPGKAFLHYGQQVIALDGSVAPAAPMVPQVTITDCEFEGNNTAIQTEGPIDLKVSGTQFRLNAIGYVNKDKPDGK